MAARDLHDAFVEAACVPLADRHGAGTLEEAEAILTVHPGLAGSSIHVAAIRGDAAGVAGELARDPAAATATGGPHAWDPLTHLCFSRYLRLDPGRSAGFVRAATALLDAGADPNTGFFWDDHLPEPTFESVLYGAAGVAHHPGVTGLLLERGADPNDGETPYHAPEGLDDRAMQLVVLSGRLDPAGLTTMLHRKLDWADRRGATWLLEHGADPDRLSAWGDRALHHSLARVNNLATIELLLDHGADPTLPAPAQGAASAVALAARQGRGDVLDLLARRGQRVDLEGDLAFLAACAVGDAERAGALLDEDGSLLDRLDADPPGLVETFAGAGNTSGVALLLDLGTPLSPTALHVAVWREREDTVRLLLERGAPLEQQNAVGQTPLDLARRALVEPSDFTPHASSAIVSLLLAAAG
jgi:ankyrin repeat protein